MYHFSSAAKFYPLYSPLHVSFPILLFQSFVGRLEHEHVLQENLYGLCFVFGGSFSIVKGDICLRVLQESNHIL